MKLAPGIEVDKEIAFGRPRIAWRDIKTSAIWRRYQAGESVGAIALDYGLTDIEVHVAIAFEAGRAWADHGRKKWNSQGSEGK